MIGFGIVRAKCLDIEYELNAENLISDGKVERMVLSSLWAKIKKKQKQKSKKVFLN